MNSRKRDHKGNVQYRTRSERHLKSGKKSLLKRVIKVVTVFLLLAVLAGVAYGGKLFFDAENLMDKAYKPRRNAVDMNETIVADVDPFSILVMGIDDNEERQLGTARTDTLLLVTVNPQTEVVNTLSIPRDTFTYIESDNFTGYAKINAAYTYDQEDGAIAAVENLLSVPINFYVTLDFQAFEKIVDALGGVDVDVPVAISEANADVTKMIELEPGLQTLSGEQALAFARTRKIDNDIKRGERQQMVIQAVIRKALSLGSVASYPNVINSLNDHLWTDMNSSTMMTLAKSSLSKNYEFNSFTFSWMSFNYSYTGESMVGIYEDSLEYISHKLKVSLGLEEEDERDAPDYEFQSDGVTVSEKTYPLYGDGVESDNFSNELIYDPVY